MKRKSTTHNDVTRDLVLRVATRNIPAKPQPQSQPKPSKHGKLDYLVRAKKTERKPTQPVTVEHKEYAKARYIGNGERLTAFVWLDDELLPRVDAANDE